MMRNTLSLVARCGLGVTACAGAAHAQTWTFDSPNFTPGEVTPLLFRAPDVSPGAWTATFTTPALAMQIGAFPYNGLMVGNHLSVPFGSTSLMIYFNQPVDDLTLDFAVNGGVPGYQLHYATATGSGTVPAVNVGGGFGFWGGTLSLTGLGGATAISLFASAPGNTIVEFAIDNLSVPAPGAAALLGLGGLAALQRRR